MTTPKWTLQKWDINKLIEYPDNPRKITKKQMKHLKNNIEKFGLIDKPIINCDGTIIAGHQRIRVMRQLGHTEIEVMVPDRHLNNAEVQELNFRHNNNGGYNDDDMLSSNYEYIDLMNWGYQYLIQEEEATKPNKRVKVTFEFENMEKLTDEIQNDMSRMVDEWNAIKFKIKG